MWLTRGIVCKHILYNRMCSSAEALTLSADHKSHKPGTHTGRQLQPPCNIFQKAASHSINHRLISVFMVFLLSQVLLLWHIWRHMADPTLGLLRAGHACKRVACSVWQRFWGESCCICHRCLVRLTDHNRFNAWSGVHAPTPNKWDTDIPSPSRWFLTVKRKANQISAELNTPGNHHQIFEVCYT